MHSFLGSLQRESMLHLLFLLRYCNSPYRLCAESTFVSKIGERSSRKESMLIVPFYCLIDAPSIVYSGESLFDDSPFRLQRGTAVG
jgi:hypothetical protein